jgi:hypothetical protein
MIFARARRHFLKSRPVRLFGEPINRVDTARYLGVTLDTRLTWSPHIDQVRKKAAQRLRVLDPLLNRRSGLPIGNGVLLYKQLIRATTRAPYGGSLPAPMPGGYWCYSPSLAIGAPRSGSSIPRHNTTALTDSLDSKLDAVGNAAVRHLGRYSTLI